MSNGSFVEKDWECSGLRCVVLANVGGMGYRCGYVAVLPGHPLYEKGYSELTNVGVPDELISVHGGVTFSEDKLYTDNEALNLEGMWWFGYDCMHGGDSPFIQDLDYCVAECESMASQLSALDKDGDVE